jgi:hypothetical protein
LRTEAGNGERIRVGEIRDGDLNVDHVLGGEPRNRRGADVIDAERTGAETPAMRVRQRANS